MKIRNAIILALALAFPLAGCGPSPTQKARVSALARAMALSTDESAAIAKQLRALAAKSAIEGPHAYQGMDIPDPLKDLEPLAVVVSAGLTRIELSGSGEDEVYLLFRELETGQDGSPHGELIIYKGAGNGSEVWWRD